MEIEITDRYKATGTPYPTKDSCNECEGMGITPCQATELNSFACESPKGRVLIVGQKEKNGSPCSDDGWLFVQCPFCEGTKKNSCSCKEPHISDRIQHGYGGKPCFVKES